MIDALHSQQFQESKAILFLNIPEPSGNDS